MTLANTGDPRAERTGDNPARVGAFDALGCLGTRDTVVE
jgi:hypothetical protein